MKARSRIVGLVFFVVLVAAIQIAENLYRWYVHREDRVHLTVLREELIDAGAAMIEAQLEVARIREEVEDLDRGLGGDRIAHELRIRRGGHADLRLRGAAAGGALNARIRDRNLRINDLNAAVVRRNSAAARYSVLADSIRTVANRVRDPYFAIPLPAEAATQRGIAPEERPSTAAPRGAASKLSEPGQR